MTASPPRLHFLYGRVSSEEQAEAGTIADQQYALDKLVQLERLPVGGGFWDQDVSGMVPIEERPEGGQLIAQLRAHPGSVVLVDRLDRLSRDGFVGISAVRLMKSLGCELRSAKEQFDDSPEGEFVRWMFTGMAQLGRRQILRLMNNGRDRKVRQARWTNGPVPFGYDTSAYPAGFLVPSERIVEGLGITEADLVRDIFRRFARGETSTVAEARWLNALGVPTARRYGNGTTVTVGETWLPSRVNRMIHNSVYRGEHVYGSKLAGEEGIVREVPALVDVDTWQQAQRALTRNRALSKRNAKQTYLLRGLIRCGDCGAGYAHTWTANGRGPGKPDRYYRCNGQLGVISPDPAARCHAKRLLAEPLERAVWEHVKAFGRDPQGTLAAAQAELRARLGDLAQRQTRETQLRKALAGKDVERNRVLDMRQRGHITIDELEQRLAVISGEGMALRAELDDLRNAQTIAEEQERQIAAAAAMLRSVADNMETIEQAGDVEAMRKIVERFVARMVVHTETYGTGSRPRKRATVEITYTFGERVGAAVDTNGSTSDNTCITPVVAWLELGARASAPAPAPRPSARALTAAAH